MSGGAQAKTNTKPSTRGKLTPYPAYRSTGVKWQKELPEHWGLKRLKSLATIHLSNVDKKSVEGQEPVRLCNYVDVYHHDKVLPDFDFMRATATPEQIRKFTLRKGDVIITKDSETWTDIAVPAYVPQDIPGVLCGYHLALIRPGNACDGAYLAYAFRAIGPRDQFQISANGMTRFGLGSEAISSSLFALPPLDEQRAITRFLDRETSKIDALVAKKARMIELLKEKRSALITRAVTRGLNPKAPLKESGVEWLGKIPSHWNVAHLKRLASMKAGSAITAEKIRPEGEFPVFGGNGIRGFTDSFTHIGDFPLVGRQGALCGCVTRASGKFWASEHAIVVKPRRNVETSWLTQLLKSMGLNTYSESAAQPGIAIDTINVIPVPKVSVEEQIAIARHIEHETSAIDYLERRICEATSRLKEYRSALITAAVTGKIDVRDAA